jgi:HK97 family phage major capsid protein
MNVVTRQASFVKISAVCSLRYELAQDFPDFEGWAPGEVASAIHDCENAQILSGSGEAPNMLGILNVDGLLTRDALNSETDIDALVASITDLRTGPSFAVADLIVMNPVDWQYVSTLKTTIGSYVLQPMDPNRIGEWRNEEYTKITSFMGVPVAHTTKMPRARPSRAILGSAR